MSPGHKELFQDILKKPAVDPEKARLGQFWKPFAEALITCYL